MSTRRGHGELCSLVGQWLRPLLDTGARACSAEATEKGILIALSQVFRQVKQWTIEFDSHEGLSKDFVNRREHSAAACSCSDDRRCFSMIIDNLLFLVACDSQYIQHLAGNTLVAIAEFLDASENYLEDIIDLLCIFLEQELSICLSSASVSTTLNTRVSDIDPTYSRSKLTNKNFLVVAGIFRVLHNILKHLKREYDGKIPTPYLDSFNSLIFRMPWDSMSQFFAGPDIGAIKKDGDVSLHRKDVQQRELSMLFANMIQFLCCLIELSNCVEEGLLSRPFIQEIINLMPKIIVWCHARPEYHVRVSRYFRHKVLMLMMKLSDSISIDSNVLMSWIHLIQQYFEDLLLQPLNHKGKVYNDDFREGSPFCTSVSDSGMSSMPSRHLQRLTVSIFLKCCINLATMKGISDDQRSSALVDVNMNSQCGYKNKGFMELNKWLEAHIPADLTEDGFYLEGCLRFTSSFLNLFINEDDLLFDALLQLLRLPFHADHRNTGEKPVAEAERYHNFLTSDLFNPVHLFHLFLSELMYDHQVLLDYLISKDTGSRCAEYLLRSLRIVCNFWELFVEFPGAQETLGETSSKRRKFVLESSDFKELPSSARLNDGTMSSHCNKCDEAKQMKLSRSHRQPFLSAHDCLMSLKNSIGSLHQKNLFPYNPKALLQRLARFEELSSSNNY